jgi:hypothetical protein
LREEKGEEGRGGDEKKEGKKAHVMIDERRGKG